MIKFTPLASSSAGCAYKLEGEGDSSPLLLDCGLPFQKLQELLGFNLSRFGGCLLSHAHGDHCKAAKKLMDIGMSIYASKETFSALFEFGVKPPHEAQEVLPGKTYIIGSLDNGWRIKAFEVVHDTPGTFAFLIGSPDKSLCLYLTDSAYCPYRFEGLTHIFVECNFAKEIIKENSKKGGVDMNRYRRTMNTHMSLDRLIDMLKANDLSKVEEIHLLHLSDANSDEKQFKEAVQKATGKPVYIAKKFSKEPGF